MMNLKDESFFLTYQIYRVLFLRYEIYRVIEPQKSYGHIFVTFTFQGTFLVTFLVHFLVHFWLHFRHIFIFLKHFWLYFRHIFYFLVHFWLHFRHIFIFLKHVWLYFQHIYIFSCNKHIKKGHYNFVYLCVCLFLAVIAALYRTMSVCWSVFLLVCLSVGL